MQLVLCDMQLNQPDDVPITIYKTKNSKVIYLTGNKIAKLLRKAVYSGQTQAVLCSFLAGLDLRIAWRGRKVSGLHQEEAPLAGWLLQDVPKGSSHRPTLACQCIASCSAGGYGTNCYFVKGCYFPVYYDGGNGRSRHAQIRRQNGLNDYLFTLNNYLLNYFTNYSPEWLPPQLANTSQPHSLTVPLGIKSAYRACNSSIACSHAVPVWLPATHVDRMPTSWNSEFPQQDQIETNRTVPIILIHCTIYHRAHQILKHYVWGIPRVL